MIRITLAVTAAAFLFVDSAVAVDRCITREDADITPHRELRWDDFRARPPRMALDTAVVAMSLRRGPYAIERARRADDSWTARLSSVCPHALMHKRLSWSKPEAKLERALAHEQGHFDIAEAFARRLAPGLLALEGRAPTPQEAEATLRRRITREYKRTVAEWKAMEQRYDRETRQGLDRKRQRIWVERIDQLLDRASGERARERRTASADPIPAGDA